MSLLKKQYFKFSYLLFKENIEKSDDVSREKYVENKNLTQAVQETNKVHYLLFYGIIPVA